MNLRKFISSALLIIIYYKLQGQELLIKYDFISDKMKYYHVYANFTKQIARPIANKNYEVRLEIVNFNQFIFLAKCNWKQTQIDENINASSIAGLFTGGSFASGFTSLLPQLNLQDLDPSKITGRDGTASLLKSVSTARTNYNDMNDYYAQLLDLQNNLAKIDALHNKVHTLKYNPFLPADTLKHLVKTMLYQSLENKSLSKKENPNFSAAYFLNYSNNLYTQIQEAYTNFNMASDKFLNEYNNFEKGNSDFLEKGFDKEISKLQSNIETFKKRYTSEKINETINKIESEYESIIYSPFTYICNSKATGDLISLELTIYESNAKNKTNILGTADINDTLRQIRTKVININIKGDIKINTSLGIGFPGYFNSNKIYYVNDTVIGAKPGNNWAPCLASFINFYAYKGKNTHWGGTFGIGIPIEKEGTANMNIFLGGSCILGSINKVTLNAGFSVGQLELLDRNSKVGDLIQSNTVPTRKGFKTGAFFGIGFTIAGK